MLDWCTASLDFAQRGVEYVTVCKHGIRGCLCGTYAPGTSEQCTIAEIEDLIRMEVFIGGVEARFGRGKTGG